MNAGSCVLVVRPIEKDTSKGKAKTSNKVILRGAKEYGVANIQAKGKQQGDEGPKLIEVLQKDLKYHGLSDIGYVALCAQHLCSHHVTIAGDGSLPRSLKTKMRFSRRPVIETRDSWKND